MEPKARILFVDDEPRMLTALRRSMLDMDDEWEMVFCDGGAAALEEMARQPADVVVSDMRMPSIDGARLLDEIRTRFPAAVRVILSGFAETDSVLRTVGPAHVYLSKPCAAETLIEAIRRPLSLRHLLVDPVLWATIGGLSSLPSLPRVFVEIRNELLSPNASAASIATLLSADVTMKAEILKLTNSSFFSLGAKVSTALQAVRILGMETLQTLVLEVGLFRQFAGDPALAAVLESVNRYGLSLGQLAGQLAKAADLDEEAASAARCAAMLSVVGALILLDSRPDRMRAVFAGAAGPLATVERDGLGTTHHLVGAGLLGLWGFSDDVVEAVAYAAEPALARRWDNPILPVVHAATALGPRFPLLAPAAGNGVALDTAFMIEARRDGHLKRWRQVAENFAGGERDV